MHNDDWGSSEFDARSEDLYQRTEELYGINDLYPDENGLIEAPVMPMRGVVVFPQMVSPLLLGRDSTVWAIQEARAGNQTLLAFVQRDPRVENPEVEDLYPIGVELAVGELINIPDGAVSALAQARRRVELVEMTQTDSCLYARARPIFEDYQTNPKTEATMRSVLDLFKRCVEINRRYPEDAYFYASNIDDPGMLDDMITTVLAPETEI